MRRFQLPKCSFRDTTPGGMAGAIFMSNSETRDTCFGTGVFGLPPEYHPFVATVKQGMPLFLFDYTDRKLYGVFEATSDGGMDIRRAAFHSTGRTYPAQVCFNIVWKCRPLTEDEFFPAIEDNYYNSKKFYFDLSYQQVVNLYGLFEKKRVGHPVSNYSASASFEKELYSRRRPDKRSFSPSISPPSADQSHSLIPSNLPNISTVETNCSASTSMHPIMPPTFETQPNVSMPLVTVPFGVQTAPIHNNQLRLPYHHGHEDRRGVSTIDGNSTQLAAPFSQTPAYHRDHFVANQSYPLSNDYLPNRLSSGCSTQGPADGVRLSVKHSYDEGSSSLYSRCLTQVPTGDDRSYLSSTPYVPSYPHFPSASLPPNANLKDDYYDNCEQCKAMYASEHQHLKRGKSLTPPELTQQGIPAYPEVSAISQQKEIFSGYIPIPDCPADFEKEQTRRDFSHDGSGSPGSGNDTGGYVSDQPYTNSDAGGESNMPVPSQRPRKTVFARMSMKPQPHPQEVPGPSLNQLLYSLSKRTEQWSSNTRIPTENVYKQLVSEQDIDGSYAPADLNMPTGVEEKESTDPPFLNFKRRSKGPSLDIDAGNGGSDNKAKRRKLVRPSFGQSNNATASSEKELLQGNVISESNHNLAIIERNHSPVETVGNKLAENVVTESNRSSAATVLNKIQENVVMEMNESPVETVQNNFQENVMMESNHSPVEAGGNKIQDNVMMEMNHIPDETAGNKLEDHVLRERNHSPVEAGGNKFFIDLNEPASVDTDLVEENSAAPCPADAAVFKTQTEKPSEVNVNQPNCSNSEAIGKKDLSPSDNNCPPTDKITLDLSITDLNMMDEEKLQAILGSSLLQALDKLRNGGGKSNDSEKADNKSSLCGKNGVGVKIEMKPDSGSTNRTCN